MPRIARIVLPGLPHHVTQRGNNRQDVFCVNDDRRLYLEILNEEARRHGVAVLGYCLMTNHVHLILVPDRSVPLKSRRNYAAFCLNHSSSASLGVL
ncbi:MAG: transposase [Deltaproteobacteria bacterium]|nr:transposase [Deltaproteobacteria bacterium]